MRPAPPTRFASAVPAALLVCVLAAAPARAGDPDHLTPGPQPAAVRAVKDTTRYVTSVDNVNEMGITITNYGFIGNNFVSRAPSVEYPLGTGIDHVVRSGLWVGARSFEPGTDTLRVSTGAIDGSQGGGSSFSTEWTPTGVAIDLRSKLSNNRYYNPLHAVSELDMVSSYSDKVIKNVVGNSEAHHPLNVTVRQENYGWSFADYAHFVIFHFVIRNDGLPLQNMWAGIYAEFSSGDKNQYSCWPPSQSCSTVGSWFQHKWIAYDDSLRLFREHYCFQQPIPNGCVLARAPYWAGMKLLGVHPGNIADTTQYQVTFAPWAWAPGSSLRDEDRERYQIMSQGYATPVVGDSLLPVSGDPVELLAVGPFRELDTGDSVTVDFAFVGGREIEDIQQHARVAQRAYDRNYIVPVPPPSPRLRAVARHGAIDLYWDDSPESAEDVTSPILKDFEGYRVYVGEERTDLRRIAQYDLAAPPHDTTGFNTGLDSIRLATPVVIDGVSYKYRYTIPSLRDGFKYFVAVTSYDIGNSEIESLESGIPQNKTMVIPAPAPGERVGSGGVAVFPNPYRVEARWDQGQKVRDHYLWFANLPEHCTIRIFTLSGDLVFQTHFDGAAYHGDGARGIYDPKRELDVDAPTMSGATYGWNLITRKDQAAATGLYMYSIEDDAGGKRSVGKFLIVKSDREE